MKKLMYVITLSFISGIMFSCADELVSPVEEEQKIETIPSVENSTGGDPDKDSGVKGG